MSLDISNPGLVMICGMQGGGKSHLIRYIMREQRERFHIGLVFTNTGFSSANFDYINKDFIHPEYDEEVLIQFKKLFEGLIKKGKKPSGFIIFDDCLAGKQWNSVPLKNLVTQLRHYNILMIISTQYPQAIPPIFRTNAFQVIMFHMSGRRALQELYDSYGQMAADSFEEFKRFFIQRTSAKYQFIIFQPLSGERDTDARYKTLMVPREIPKFTIDPYEKSQRLK